MYFVIDAAGRTVARLDVYADALALLDADESLSLVY